MLLERGIEIGRDARHALHAERLAAGLFDAVEYLARHLGAGARPPMHLVVVVAQAQRDGVGLAAHRGRILGRQIARRQRQPRLGADQTLSARGEARRDVVALANGANRRAGGAAETLDWIFDLGHGG